MQVEHKTVSATKIKNRFGDYLAEVVSSRNPLIVERHGKPLAVLIDYHGWMRSSETAESGLKKTETPWSDACRRLAHSIHRRASKTGRPSKHSSSVAIIRQIREEEY